MNNQFELIKYCIRLVITGINKSEDTDAVQVIADELRLRTYLSDIKVSWDENEDEVIVQINAEDFNAKSIGNQMAEELFEIAYALLNDIDNMNIQVLDVSQPA